MKKLSIAVAMFLFLALPLEARASESCGCPSNGLLQSDNSTDTTQAIYGYNGVVNGIAIWGNANAANGSIGVQGDGSLYGSYGTSGNGEGVFGSSTNNNGVQGESASGGASGVYGDNTSSGGYGVAGRAATGGVGVYGDNSNGTTGWAGKFNGRVYVNTGLQVGGTCVSGSCSSDLRLKQKIEGLGDALDKLSRLRPVTFEWKDAGSRLDRPVGRRVGLIAQEVETVFPNWVSTDSDGFKTVNRDDLPILLLQSVRELKAENDVLRSRVALVEETHVKPLVGGAGLGVGCMGLAMLFASRRKKTS